MKEIVAYGAQEAFPRPAAFNPHNSTEWSCEAPGITKREWMVGMALQGILSNSESPDRTLVAEMAVSFADAALIRLMLPQIGTAED